MVSDYTFPSLGIGTSVQSPTKLCKNIRPVSHLCTLNHFKTSLGGLPCSLQQAYMWVIKLFIPLWFVCDLVKLFMPSWLGLWYLTQILGGHPFFSVAWKQWGQNQKVHLSPTPSWCGLWTCSSAHPCLRTAYSIKL